MSTTTVTTSAELISALKIAQAGDTVQLASGTYSAFSLNNLHFASDVTITSQDPTHAAVIGAMTVNNSSGLTFTNLDFTVSGPPKSAIGVTVNTSQDIHFDHVYVHGSLDSDPSNDGSGMMLRNSTDVSVAHSTFEQLYWGFAHVDDTRVQVTDNEFHDMRMDGIRGGGSSNVTITGNYLHDFHPNTGDHGDAIQFWTSGTKVAAHDILVANNVFQRGDGEVTQGVFMRDEGKLLPFQHVTITGNLIIGGMYNGIVVFGANDVSITNNIVQGFGDMKSWIQVSRTDGAVVTDNSANQFIYTDTATHVTTDNNSTVAQSTDGGAAMTALWTSLHDVVLPPQVPDPFGGQGQETAIPGTDVPPDFVPIAPAFGGYFPVGLPQFDMSSFSLGWAV